MENGLSLSTIFRRLISMLESNGYYLVERRLRKKQGKINYGERGRITIESQDPVGPKLSCLIHEGLHEFYQMYAEEDEPFVLGMELLVFKSLSMSQYHQLIDTYLNLLRKGRRRSR